MSQTAGSDAIERLAVASRTGVRDVTSAREKSQRCSKWVMSQMVSDDVTDDKAMAYS